MSIFKFFKFFVILAICFYLIFIIIDIKNYAKKVSIKNKDGKVGISEIKKQLYKTSISTFIFGISLGVFFCISHALQDGDLAEFTYNFNYATSHFYKELDRKELLNKAFDTVLKDMDDEYTEVLKSSFENYIKDGIEDSSGYSISMRDGGGVFISKINNESIKNMGLEEDDEIISINGIDVQRHVS